VATTWYLSLYQHVMSFLAPAPQIEKMLTKTFLNQQEKGG
jgi:hypothetical protein